MVRELYVQYTKDVIWQAQAKRKWLVELLANEGSINPLIRFLQATEIGVREGAREMELEWEQKND